MRLKSFLAPFLILVLVLSLAACSTNVVSPENTIKPPEDTQSNSVKIMNEYRELMNKNSSPSEILKFAEANIGNLNKEDADTVVSGLIDIQNKQLENYRDKLYSREMNAKTAAYSYEDLVNLKNIKDEDVKSLFENAFNDGYKLIAPEGMYDFELDYENLNSKFSGFVSEAMAAYLGIMAEQSKAHFATDGSLSITPDELAGRVVNAEKFIEKYGDKPYASEVKQLYSWYLPAYLLGLNNTPAFSYEDNTLKPEFLTSFKNSATKYADSGLAKTLNDYIKLLEKNDLKKTREVLEFVNKTVPSAQQSGAPVRVPAIDPVSAPAAEPSRAPVSAQAAEPSRAQ